MKLNREEKQTKEQKKKEMKKRKTKKKKREKSKNKTPEKGEKKNSKKQLEEDCSFLFLPYVVFRFFLRSFWFFSFLARFVLFDSGNIEFFSSFFLFL